MIGCRLALSEKIKFVKCFEQFNLNLKLFSLSSVLRRSLLGGLFSILSFKRERSRNLRFVLETQNDILGKNDENRISSNVRFWQVTKKIYES